MGGLKKDLPITYWTFLIGALAIAGVPGSPGSSARTRSSDRTFAERALDALDVGVVTSLLTAIYMFRLVFLTFHGERRAASPHTARTAGARGSTHGTRRCTARHGRICTTRRRRWRCRSWSWRWARSLAGYVGVPARSAAATGIEHFLEPSFAAHAQRRRRREAARGPRAPAAGLPAPPAEAAQRTTPGSRDRRMLMASVERRRLRRASARLRTSLRNGPTAGAVAASAGLHRLLLNKYYVDEIYDAAIVQPIKLAVARRSLEGRGRGADRRRGQRPRGRRARRERGPAAAPDRLGARLRRVALLGVVVILG